MCQRLHGRWRRWTRITRCSRGEKKLGANDGARTRDIQDHNLALYQLSYDRRGSKCLPETGANRNRVRAARGLRFGGVSLRSLILVVLLAGTARAQPSPRDPAPEPQRERRDYGHHGRGGLGMNFALASPASLGTIDGWLGRLEYELLVAYGEDDEVGPVAGIVGGAEYWRMNGDSGFAMPVGMVIGIRAVMMRATVGFGIHAITIDEIADDTGVGLYGPYAGTTVGFDVRGIRVFADARVSRHWQFGADDFTQWQLGLAVGYTMAPPKYR